MRIMVNGTAREVTEGPLDAVLTELGYGGAKVATALNAEFVPAGARGETRVRAGDALEILAPKQGG